MPPRAGGCVWRVRHVAGAAEFALRPALLSTRPKAQRRVRSLNLALAAADG